ncbi:hypothetical protein BJ508DRAFT_336067 [Ascobolus immersus RN42]|uniref:Kelch repeat protein n=1 Tax=Ascobolus immersus RN42 TaxID=1160509 RepID=A0A3N4HDW1_ASCIM|nr:hypothetical protein BJ508DRAFT_336067 [Ascobolus immersus RN42]
MDPKLLFWANSLIFFLALTPVLGGNVIGIQSLRGSETEYSISENFCRLLAHKTLVIGDKLVIDGGMAKFKITLNNGSEFEVPDLNPFTITIDLSTSFSIDALPLTEHRRPDNVPVLNRFVMWQDPSNKYYYISGGHFYGAKYWNESRHYLEDEEIPNYNIWRYDLEKQEWSEEDFKVDGGGEVTRLISSADVSIPNQGVSFAYGGYSSRRSRPSSIDDDRNLADNSLLVYNHETQTLRNITNPSSSSSTGVWHGALHHLPLGEKGFLVALMGEAQTKGQNFTESDLTGRENLMLDWKSIQIWDIEKEKWYTQQASFINDKVPKPRSRFCSVMVYDEGKKSWDIWVYGGQDLKDPESGVSDIWVLSMPSFMWHQVTETGSAPIRTHSCRAFGSQLMIIGGYPPGYSVIPTESCGDGRLVRIYDLNTGSWPDRFDPKAPKYQQREEITRKSILNPDNSPTSGWSHDRLKEAFNLPINEKEKDLVDSGLTNNTITNTKLDEDSPKKKTSIAPIVGGVVGGVVALLLLLCLCCGRNRDRECTFGWKASWWYRRWFAEPALLPPVNRGRATDSHIMPPYELPPDASRNAYLAPRVHSPLARDSGYERSSNTPSQEIEGGPTRVSGYGAHGGNGSHEYYGKRGSAEGFDSGSNEKPDLRANLSRPSDGMGVGASHGVTGEELREGVSSGTLKEERRRRGKEDYDVGVRNVE